MQVKIINRQLPQAKPVQWRDLYPTPRPDCEISSTRCADFDGSRSGPKRAIGVGRSILAVPPEWFSLEAHENIEMACCLYE